MPWRTDTPMRLLRRRRSRRLDSLTALLIELEQLAHERRGARSRSLLRL